MLGSVSSLCFLMVGLLALQTSALTSLLPSKAPVVGPDRFYQFTDQMTGTQSLRYKAIKSVQPGFPPFSRKKTPIVCIHGFGGNADQFRRNLPVLAAAGHDCYALDLLGYGYSSRPNPKAFKVNSLYNFENWGDQALSFVRDVVKEPCVFVCNSIGGVVGLQAAVTQPTLVKGVVLIDISLRMLHVKKQSPLVRPVVSLLQTVLRETGVGQVFFKQVAQTQAIKNILSQAYASPVDDEIAEIILKPGLLPGAADVFLDFISYSGGPLPEELLPKVFYIYNGRGSAKCMILILQKKASLWQHSIVETAL